MVPEWSGNSLGVVWEWSGIWSGNGLGVVWEWSGSGLARDHALRLLDGRASVEDCGPLPVRLFNNRWYTLGNRRLAAVCHGLWSGVQGEHPDLNVQRRSLPIRLLSMTLRSSFC